jgi:hypothetical protein
MVRKINPGKYRKLSPAELAKVGAPSKSERYVRVGTKRVTKRTATVSRRAYEQAKLGATLEKAVKQRQSGERPYKTMATRAAAQKQRTTRQTIAQARNFTAAFEQRTRDPNVIRLRPPSRPYTRKSHARDYRLSGERRYDLPFLRQRKLDGEFIDDWGKWKTLVDFARRINDPALPLLLKS